MGLIDFLFGNIVYVIIIIGFIISVLNKMSKAGGQPAGRPGIPQRQPDYEREYEYEEQQVEEPRRTYTYAEPAPSPQPVFQARDRAPLTAASERSRPAQQPKSVERRPERLAPKPAALRNSLQHATADDLRQGVLWAEILGKPRAKRPYGSERK